MKIRKVTLRRLLDLPAKRQTKIIRKKSSYRKPRIAKIKKPTKFQQGLLTAQSLTKSWNSQSNPSQVYVFDRRVHHGELGVVLGLAGLYKNDPYLTGLGTGLAIDDLHDVNEWFTFKKREPSLRYNPNFA
ncbi:hypothetical protein [Candidatus Nitrosotenuis cloacae]|uniref:hypothetical protein n=1 Tax=Candidatus Nitrosotenuis cloacae TaxID=1603555 RepID=UPI0022819ADA|nr:hypothetical protein [Candidatus Nitrosotenuis cloacae]